MISWSPSLVTGYSTNADLLKDIIVAKIKGSDGSILWSRLIGGATPTVGGPGNQTCDAVAIADDGNVLIGGGYLGTIDFGSGAFPTVSGVLNVQPWVAKLNGSNGNTLYATSFQMVGTKGRADIRSLAVDASGNVVIGGQITRGPMLFGAYTLTPAGTDAFADAFAAKLNPSLTVLWAKSWGDAAVQDLKGLSIDSAGDVTIVGVLNGSMDLGPIGLLSSAGSADAFLAKLNGADGIVKCASRYGDEPGSQQAKSIAIARFAAGADKDTAYVSGVFSSGMDFGIPGKAPLQSPSTSQNLMFFVRINNP